MEEIQTEQDPVSGRWSIPDASLEGPSPRSRRRRSWRVYEKERLLAELGEWKARAERERERAEGFRDEVEGLRKDLEVERIRRHQIGGTPETQEKRAD